ncbi:cation transporter [Pseudomonas sp. TH32]|jgi:hypothetical protein|uniref:DUF6482 family protein n=1 Tax=unclassified Pseudomonas TaxID=196821 RepID=UPI0019143AAA|nr:MULTISPECIES: DUF6482 family protein [unclassified Pseudomonas]MBK5439892.1 cation transporter [Pseudomonas sp. TH32]MDF3199400.1 DUF6482 family protein [Pseudomonas sp. 1912-s]
MNLQELYAYATVGRIDQLSLISLEGGIYVLEARMQGRAYPLGDDQGKTLHLRSVEHARQLLHKHAMPKMPFELVHTSVHDEMCGMPPGAEESLRLPIAIHSAW